MPLQIDKKFVSQFFIFVLNAGWYGINQIKASEETHAVINGCFLLANIFSAGALYVWTSAPSSSPSQRQALLITTTGATY